MAVKKAALKILVVDDDSGLLTLMVDGLRHMGISLSVSTAQDTHHAVQKLLSVLPDLLVTDLQLPDGSGIDLCAFCRANRELTHTKVLAITGHHSAITNWKALDHGADEYLRKPFTPDELRQAVKRLLGLTGTENHAWQDLTKGAEEFLQGGTQ